MDLNNVIGGEAVPHQSEKVGGPTGELYVAMHECKGLGQPKPMPQLVIQICTGYYLELCSAITVY